MHHLSASIFYSRQPNGGRDRRSAAFRNAFSPRRPSSRPIRIEGEEADHCLAKQRAGLLVSSINPRLSASDGQQWERRLVMRETSIHPTLDSSFKKKKIPPNIGIPPYPFHLETWFLFDSRRKIFFCERCIRIVVKYLTNFMFTKSCFHAMLYILRNLNWHAIWIRCKLKH